MNSQLPLIIEPADLEAVLNDPNILIVDLCQAQTYQQFHVPGAVHINPSQLVCGIPPAGGKLPSLPQLNQLFAEIAYDPNKHIIAYDDEGGGWAGRFIWTLDVIGHKNYSYLNGGIYSWHKERHPLQVEANIVEPVEQNLSINTDFIAEVDTILDSLDKPNIKIWDARSPEEYDGTKILAKRGGHIPGAVNMDWLEVMDRNNNLRLLPLDTLAQTLAERGINADDEIITHCQTHHRSGLTYLAAKALGHKAKGYHGSWSEWGNLPDTPIE